MKARVIAYYLPQYHPIPENDKYWGKGFTEWTNVAKAKPLFRGHDQPHIPADLGFYDLRLPEIREAQANLAREAGIEGFCYWHYWFGGGKELLEMPFNEVVNSGKPDFPFCLGWANHNWSTKTWVVGGQIRNEMIAEQTYPGTEDYILHFNTYLRAFKDKRYIKVDGKLLFVVFAPLDMPDSKAWMEKWNELAHKNGLNGFHFVGISENFTVTDNTKKCKYSFNSLNGTAKTMYQNVFDKGFDAVNSRGTNRAQAMSTNILLYYFKRLLMKMGLRVLVRCNYKKIIENYYVEEDRQENVYPTIIPNFDRTPRAGWNTNNLWFNSTPQLFRKHVEKALKLIEGKSPEHAIIFLQSWNEWGEGNYMEPDVVWGHQYIDVLRNTLNQY